MVRILAWTPSLTGGIVAVRDPCLHGRFSIGSLCVGPSDTMSWSPTIGLLITPLEPIQPRLGGRVQRLPNTFRTEVVVCSSPPATPVPCGEETAAAQRSATGVRRRRRRPLVVARATSLCSLGAALGLLGAARLRRLLVEELVELAWHQEVQWG